MPSDAEITFADHTGRFYARRYGFPPMVGRLIGYLSVCDPPDQSIADLSEALLASRSAITGAIKNLETLRLLARTRSAGERMDKVRLDLSSPHAFGFDISEYEEMGAVAREGLKVLAGAPPQQRVNLMETACFADFLVEQLPLLEAAWNERRDELIAAGHLPRREDGR